MQKIILDTDIDTLRCYECRELMEPDEAKVIVGYGPRGGAWAFWHPGCYSDLAEDVESVLREEQSEYREEG
jgi:hypothetical protein